MDKWLELARELHAEAVVVDGHADTPQRFADEGWEWTSKDLDGGQISAATAREGGLDGEFFALWVEPHRWEGRYVERTFHLLQAMEEQARRHPEALALCRTPDEVRKARLEGRFAALLGIEGGHSIAGNLDLLAEFYRRGVRYMTLTWSNTNDWCDSSNDRECHGGLSDFGRDVVREMNRLGMMVDISHVSDRAFWKAVEASAAPVIASHSSARSLTDAVRNLTDEQMRAVAAKGGVVMVNFFAAFVSESFRRHWNLQRSEREMAVAEIKAGHRSRGEPYPFSKELALDRAFAMQLPRPPLRALTDHIDHALRVCGTEHVGIGSDFDGIPLAPEEIDSAADLPKITADLLGRGWKPEELRGMLGENILRVLGRAEA